MSQNIKRNAGEDIIRFCRVWPNVLGESNINLIYLHLSGCFQHSQVDFPMIYICSLSIMTVSQSKGFGKITISRMLVAAFSLRSPHCLSEMVLCTIEESRGKDNDNRCSFHQHSHHVDQLHTYVRINISL